VLGWWKRVAWGRHRVLVIGALVVALALVGVGGYLVALSRRLDHLDVRLHASRPGGTTYLIIGSDSRAGVAEDQRAAVGDVPGGRADIVLLLRVPDDGSRPVLLSVPRDLLVLGKDLGLHRLTLTWLDGPQATVDALCQSLSIGEDHLVELDLAGFSKVVDAVGGVDIELDLAVRDTVLNFEMQPGLHHLDGAAALLYVRARHLEGWDPGTSTWQPLPNERAEQARAVLAAVAEDAKPSPFDPLGAHRIAWAATGALAVDDGTGLRDLWNLARALREADVTRGIELPAVVGDGDIPFAQLAPGAHRALQRAGAGGTSCHRPALPDAG
jgi:LCP family protein required for cell wall assembly